MTVRTWLYGVLTDPDDLILRSQIGLRVFAKKSMKSSKESTPYIVFKLGNDTSEALSETVDVHRQFFQIFVHDFEDTKLGDYQLIDSIIVELKRVLRNRSSSPDGILSTIYLETSQDLNDETLGTLMKYVRFQAIIKE